MAQRFLLDDDLGPALRAAGLRAATDLLALGDPAEPRRFVGFVTLEVDGAPRRFHLKRYRYAGWRESRGLVGRGTLWGTPPEINEFEMLARLRAAGVCAVRPAAACALTSRGRLVAHALLTEAWEGGIDLAARLRDPGDEVGRSPALRRALARALGRALAGVHAAGLVHRDAHARNLLVRVEDGGVRVAWIDCRRGGRRRRADAARDLATIDRDLQGRLTRTERRVALAAYLGAGGDAKALVREIARLRERLPAPRR